MADDRERVQYGDVDVERGRGGETHQLAPSVLYDAVAILANGDSGLADLPPARDFVSDAFAHCKFIGHTDGAAALFEAVGLGDKVDGGFVALSNGDSAGGLFDACAALRYWDRESSFVA
jgi:catalase